MFPFYDTNRPLKIASVVAMSDAIDLSGDGGVLKKIVRHAKPDAIAPTQDLPLVDGMNYIIVLLLMFIC